MEAVLRYPHGRILLGRSIITIGRSPLSSVMLDDSRVSAHHAEIRSDGQGYTIVDLDSRNGILVNGQPILPHELCGIGIGDRITIGTTVMSIEKVIPSSQPLSQTLLLRESLRIPKLPSLPSPDRQQGSSRVVVKACALALLIAAAMIDISIKGLSVATLAALLNVLALLLIFFI